MLTVFAAYSNLKIITYKRKGDITHHAIFKFLRKIKYYFQNYIKIKILKLFQI